MIFTKEEWKEIEEICKDIKSHYDRFYIKKASGKKREILAPDKRMKYLQKKLLNEFIYVHYIPSVFATGFVIDRSIVDNATVHVGAKILVNVDVKDFFPSITYDMIHGIFLKTMIRLMTEIKIKKNLKKQKKDYEHQLSTEDRELQPGEYRVVNKRVEQLTKLVTYPYKKKIALPQGAPTSPAISNIVCFEMDNIFSGLAIRNKAVYTRYADDLTFSSDENERLNKIIPIIKDVLKKYNLKANERKIHVNRRSGRMSVTGLVVNDKVSYGRGRLRILRAALHNAKMKICYDKELVPFDVMHYRGMAAYINSFAPEKAAWMNKEIDQIVDGIKELRGGR